MHENLIDTSTLSIVHSEGKEENIPSSINGRLVNIMEIERFNSFTKLIRITAYVIRFIRNLKKKIQGDHLFLNVLRVDEISYAERIWIIDIQKDVYSSERYPQLKKDLRLTTLADNILRCEGRLKNAPISYDSRFPIFIPKGTFAKLLVNYYHELVHHNGLKETLNEICTRYWIPKARYFIQQIIQKCRTCKRIEGKTYIYPDSPSLPVARLSESPPFTFTGLDYAGHVHVRNMYNSSTITYKAWIFLFTCSTTRAVCLDLVPDCSA